MKFNLGEIISDFFIKAKNWLADFLNDIQDIIFALLPDSPFKNFVMPENISEILGYINWLLPFGMISNTLLIWVGAIAIYYSFQTILRWIKSIE